MYKIIVGIFLVVALGWGCQSKYAKMAKKGTVAEKDSAAVYYFNKKNYETAMPLLEELMGIYRGGPRYQKMLYYFAYCKYGLGDLITAAFYFDEFTKQFPNTDYTEEAQYMVGACYEWMSASYELDQTETQKAIEQYELFIQLYPTSPRVSQAEQAIQKLNDKLMKKAFEQANLYYKIEYYASAVTALKSFISDYPSSPYREEATFKMLKSSLEYAKISIESKQKERLQKTIEIYYKFIERYPSSRYLKQAENIFSEAQERLNSQEKNL